MLSLQSRNTSQRAASWQCPSLQPAPRRFSAPTPNRHTCANQTGGILSLHQSQGPSHSGRGQNLVPAAFKNDDDAADRITAALPYLLPLLDSFPYAKFIMVQYPFIARAFAPLGPVMFLYHSFPFAPFLIFLGVYNGIVNNMNLSRFVRYNAMQAVLLDILLIIPQVILNDLVKMPTDELGLQAYITTNNTLFLFVAVCTAYGMGSCLVGQTARLPLVAEAADTQVRDF